ncbi:MAG: TRAP transporter small permease [Desulfuromonadaceae bacterium]
MSEWEKRLDRLGRTMENLLLCVLLLTMVALAVWQIAARNLLGGGFIWADEFLKILLLWLGLAGAVAASREGKQIQIDVLSRLLPEHWQNLSRFCTSLFTALLCALCAWHGARFVWLERAYGSTVLGHAPAWLFEAAIPLAFALIAYRYLIACGSLLAKLLRGESPCN